MGQSEKHDDLRHDAPCTADEAEPDQQSRSLSAADRVRDAILAGVLTPGSRINEVHLSRDLGMSRTPIRAALHTLAAEGLIDYERNRGFIVREFALQAVLDAYEIRASLEGVACRLAAERGLTAEQKQRIETALRDGDRTLDADRIGPAELAAYGAVNVTIHETLLAAAQNRMLSEAIRMTINMPGVNTRNIVPAAPRIVRRRHDDHHRLYDLVRSGEAVRAELLMREHVISVKSGLLANTEQREMGQPHAQAHGVKKSPDMA